MKRSRIVVCAALVAAGFFPSGSVDIADAASGALLVEAAQVGAVAQDAPANAKEREGVPDAAAQVPADPQPHEAGPIDPWKPRPTIPPPGAIEHSGSWTRGGFASIQVNVDADGNNIVGDAANEPSIAIDPTNPNNIVIGWRQFDSVHSSFRQAGYAYSHDGGQTWTFPGVLDPGQFRSDPVLGVDADGNFYYYNIRCAAQGCGDIFRSEDVGRTWAGPFPAVGGDKPWMTVDATDGIGRGHVYAAWGSRFIRSTDGGRTFAEGGPASALRGTITVAPDGSVYAVRVPGEDGALVTRSTNAQDANQRPTFESFAFADMGGRGVAFRSGSPNPGGLLGQPWIDIDRSDGPRAGNIYVLATVDRAGDDPLDVTFVRSEDGGVTWSEPMLVHDDPQGSNAWQWFGTMSVAPNGRIDAVWNDTRNTGVARRSETFYAYSNDGGRSWSMNIPVSAEWDSYVGWPSQDKIGDYYHMISDEDGANLAYAATFNGEQDVYFLRVIPDCNQNGVPDDEDIRDGTSEDCNANGIPDECDPFIDCNNNGVFDACDIREGASEDCNENGTPDECEPRDDCNENGVQDICELEGNDCNANEILDECDIANGTSEDCDENGIPDECRAFIDCNDNGIRDECDVADGTSEDCNEDVIPDECQPDEDCNENGTRDLCELEGNDCNVNLVPDECEDTDPLDGFALSFERNSARVIVPDFDGFPTNEVTVSQWLRTSDTAREAGIFSYAVAAEDDEFLILDARNLSLFIHGIAVQTGVAVTDGDWHHIALTWGSEDGVGRLYVDGIERFSGVVSPGHVLRPGGTVVLADDQDSVGGGFRGTQSLWGTIDELRVWNVVRSEEDIRADMRRRLNGDEPGLVSYWRFDEGEGATAEDIAGDNDGEVIRSVWLETFDEFCGCVRDPQWVCDGDTDGDGQVNPVDSGLVQASFGSTDEATLCQYDVDCDGQINPVDSGIVQSLFGTCNAPRAACP